jgi:hypothetical protein
MTKTEDDKAYPSATASKWSSPLDLAVNGLPVLPLWGMRGRDCACRLGAQCGAPGKHPLACAVPHGVKDASTGTAAIAGWYGRFPDANWGVATGHRFGNGYVVVVDVDPRNDGDVTLADLQAEHGTLPETPRALTGGGGVHYFLLSPKPIACGILGAGVDLKGAGGYVVVAPSWHASGRQYLWDAGAHPAEVPFAVAPRWLCAREAMPTRRTQAAAVPPPESFVGRAFIDAGLAGRVLPNGLLAVRCPWADAHSDGRGFGDDSSAVVLPPRTPLGWGCFRCLHGSHGPKDTLDALRALPRRAIAVASHADPTTFVAVVQKLTRRRSRE